MAIPCRHPRMSFSCAETKTNQGRKEPANRSRWHSNDRVRQCFFPRFVFLPLSGDCSATFSGQKGCLGLVWGLPPEQSGFRHCIFRVWGIRAKRELLYQVTAKYAAARAQSIDHKQLATQGVQMDRLLGPNLSPSSQSSQA